MFIYLHKNRKGFTLIELMVVVAIIAVLALLGLRLYSTQQIKAKEALVKANAATIQVAIQTELVDNPDLTLAEAVALGDLTVITNPFNGGVGDDGAFADGALTADAAASEGMVSIELLSNVFTMNSYGSGGRDLSYEVSAQP
jgi:prepilin-type N-terminal cleavage/methylation domain-containing protein